MQLSGGPTSVTDTSASCSVQAQTVTCSLAALPAGGSTTVRVSGLAPKGGTVTAAATVDGAEGDPNAANDARSASILVR